MGSTDRVSRKRSWSLARLLIAWYAGSALTLVFASTAFLYWGLTRVFDQRIDAVLEERIGVLRRLLRHGDPARAELKWEIESEREEFEWPQVYLRILDRGRPALETPGMSQLLPPEAFPLPAGVESQGRGHRRSSASGRVFQVMAAAAADGTNPEPQWVIQVACDLAQEQVVLAGYRRLLAIVLAASALISLGLGYAITRMGIRPLEAIIQAAREIRVSTLGQRVPAAGLPSELASLAENFNDMLDRLEQAFGRLTRFAADLAHELRTPLNILRGESEVALSKARTPEEYREVLASNLEEFANLSRVVDGLLFVALAERSDTPLDHRPIELTSELRGIAEFYEPAAAEKGLRLAVESGGEVWVEAEPVLFRRAVTNLVANAVAYTPPGGMVNIRAVEQDSSVRVEVCDSGVGIAAEHLPHIFDRFYRVERARGRNSGGVGLGLSIVKAIMDLHHGSAEISSEPGRGTRAVLTFPPSRKATPTPASVEFEPRSASSNPGYSALNREY